MSDNRFDNSDWQLGMPLPSRKQTHSKKKKSKQTHTAPAEPEAASQPHLPPRRELNLEPQRALTFEPDKKPLRESALALDLQQLPSQAEPTASEAIASTDRSATTPSARAELAQGASEAAASTALTGGLTAEERDMLWGDDEEEDGPILTIWQRLLLFVLVPVVILGVLIWGKVAYVHHVPNLVRDNVSAYSSGEGFLVVKPWWFGPPVYELDAYPQADDFTMYQIKMGDHAPLTEEPFVLWRFQQDILK